MTVDFIYVLCQIRFPRQSAARRGCKRCSPAAPPPPHRGAEVWKQKLPFLLSLSPCISYEEWLLAGETGPTPPRKLGFPGGFNRAEGSCWRRPRWVLRRLGPFRLSLLSFWRPSLPHAGVSSVVAVLLRLTELSPISTKLDLNSLKLRKGLIDC